MEKRELGQKGKKHSPLNSLLLCWGPDISHFLNLNLLRTTEILHYLY